MKIEEIIIEFGIKIKFADLEKIRNLLDRQIELESKGQGNGDTELMKLFCVQLFGFGAPGDILRIWRAKSASFDASVSIDVQLLCGAGLEATKLYLRSRAESTAAEALSQIAKCESAGDFEHFDPELALSRYEAYYVEPEQSVQSVQSPVSSEEPPQKKYE